MASPCHPNLGALFWVSSAFGRLFGSLTAVFWLRLLRSPSCPFVLSRLPPRPPTTHTHHIHTQAPCSTCTQTISPPSLVREGRVRTIYPLFPALCKLGSLGNEQPSPPGSSVSSGPVPVSVSPFLFPAPCLWNIVWSWLWFHHSPWSPPWLTLCLSHL